MGHLFCRTLKGTINRTIISTHCLIESIAPVSIQHTESSIIDDRDVRRCEGFWDVVQDPNLKCYTLYWSQNVIDLNCHSHCTGFKL